MKRVFAIAVVVLGLCGAAAATVATTASGSGKKTVRIAVFLASSANTYWAA